LREHAGTVYSLAWSKEGLLASGSLDYTIIIWDLATGKPGQTLMGHSKPVESVAWSPDGRLASVSQDGTIKIARGELIQSKPCNWIYRNLTEDEWLLYQGALYIYKPACPSLQSPPGTDPVNWPIRHWQVPASIVGLVIIMVIILWVGFLVARSFLRKIARSPSQ
jgi:WD40 repeat protein